ncbi:MAG TPA: lipopolysaccharide biosynthesis protein [Gaiellaceae bacterium]|nr:lipopolysaccharide biosynthesis protein [Gaiellaceae bacterium]
MATLDASEPQLGLDRELLRATLASGMYVAADGLARAVSLVLTVLYTRYLSPADYGTLAITSTVVLLLGPLLGLSISSAVTRLWFEEHDEGERRRLVASSLGFLLVAATVMVAVVEIAGDAGAFDVFSFAHYSPYLRYAVLTAYCSVFLDLPVTILIVQRRPGRVLSLAIVNAGMTLGLSLALVVGLGEGVLGVLRANLVSAAAMAVVGLVVTLRISGNRVEQDGERIRKALRFSVPLIPSLLAQWVLQVSDRPLLAHFVSSGAVGRYYVGYSVGAIAGLLVHGASRAMQPIVLRDLKAGADTRVVRTGTYWFGALTVLCLALALWGRDLLALVAGSSFDSAVRVVPVVAAAHVAFAAYAIVSQGIWFAMTTRWVPLLTAAAGAVNVGLNVLLVPRFGLMAAAVDTAAGFGALALLFALLASRVYRIDWEYVRWAKIVLAGLAAYGVASLAGQTPSLARLGLELAGIVAVCPAALTVLGFWTPSERRALRTALRLPRL